MRGFVRPARGACAGVVASAILALFGADVRADVLAPRTSDLRADILENESLSSVLHRAEQRVSARFAEAGLAYPPEELVFVALKREARFEVWAPRGDRWAFVRSYLVRASSGQLGPKLKEGDRQVPEGIYRITALNPRSSYHLSLRLNYPNDFDRARAREEGRSGLGSDIMIHGGRASEGCLPVGDEAIEELYALTARVGIDKVTVVISPFDLRRREHHGAAKTIDNAPVWLDRLYVSIAETLQDFPLPAAGAQLPEPGSLGRLTVGRAECRAYHEGDCSRRCRSGDMASCARLGLMYRDGRGTFIDRDKAWEYLSRACAGGSASGCAELGRLYVEDDGLLRDAFRATTMVAAACKNGEGHGCDYLARLCTERIGYPQTAGACSAEVVNGLRQRAVALLRKDCDGWGAYDCSTLAGIYSTGDTPTALRFWSGSCAGGDPGGCYELGRLYETRASTMRSEDLYRRACDAGFSNACRRYAIGPIAAGH